MAGKALIGSMRADLSAGHAAFGRDMGKARKHVQTNAKGMSAAMTKVGKKFTEAATALNRYAKYAMAAAIAASVVFIKKQIDIADKMSKLAQATGTTTEYLSSMALVASQGGTTLEAVAKGVKKLSQNMDDVRRGTGEAREAFEDLDIEVTDSDKVLRKSDQVMLDIADRFKGMEDGAEKTAYAMAIFGRAGGELIPMLNGGREGIEQLQKKAEEMGLVISTKTALEAAYLNDQLDIMTKTVQGTGRSMALDLIPWLNETLAVMKLAKEESGTLMSAWVGLDAVGAAVFGKSLQQQINETEKDLERLNKIASEGANWAGGKPSGWERKLIQSIEEVEGELADLTAQKDAEEKADQDRMEASIKRMREEAEQKRKNTELIREQAQAKIDASTAEKKAIQEVKTAQEAGWAADIATYEAIQQMMADIDEGVRLSKEGLEGLADTTEEKSNDMEQAFAGWGNSFSSTLNDMLWGSEVTFESIAESFAKMVTQMMIQKHLVEGLFGGDGGGGWFGVALKAIGGIAGGGVSGPSHVGAGGTTAFGLAQGGVLEGGNVLPFAKGGVVSLPTVFPMAQGAGLMGEAGPEAVMPLKRTSSGDLGVVSSGEGGGTTIIINAIDSKSFAEVVKRNPGSIVTVINDALEGRTGLLDTIRGTI